MFTQTPFLKQLFDGTLQTLNDRVLESGFCHTSFGELGNVRCYGDCHYLRDAAECARALALTGSTDKALRILRFNLDAVPAGRRYFPHAVALDKSIVHDNIQTDTLAHSVLALEACSNAGADKEKIADMYCEMAVFARFLREDRFHLKYGLLDSGNFNEQGFDGSREPLLDIFSNASCFAMYEALSRMADQYGTALDKEQFSQYAAQLAEGIETHLRDKERNIYLPAIRPDGSGEFPLNWLSLYPVRWYAPDLEPYCNVLDMLWKTSCNGWYGIQIPSCEAPGMTFRSMGKVIAVLLSLTARLGQKERFGQLLEFIEKTVRKPDNVWPEYWFHHEPPENEYLRWFFNEYKVWTPFTADPDGDYTVDSGNCEQSAVFITEYLACQQKAVSEI